MHENAKIVKYADYYRAFKPFVIDLGWRGLGTIRWRAQIDSEGGVERGHPAPALGVLRLGGPDAAPHRCPHGADNRVNSNPRTGETRRAVEANASRTPVMTRLPRAERAAATVAGVKCRVVRELSRQFVIRSVRFN